MLLDIFTPHLETGVLVILILTILLIDSNLICLDPRAKANKIIRCIDKVNKYKKEINKLLRITMTTTDIHKVFSKLLVITYYINDIEDLLDENSKTKIFKESVEDELKELLVLRDMLFDLHYKRQRHDLAIETCDEIVAILIYYRPIYNRIYKHVDIDNLIL